MTPEDVHGSFSLRRDIPGHTVMNVTKNETTVSEQSVISEINIIPIMVLLVI